MKIVISSDHRGTQVAATLASHLTTLGHTATVIGDTSGRPVDYPDAAWLVANTVSHGGADRGVLICGTGIGMCIAANKVHGCRAALAGDELSAQLSRSHNDANVLCLSADLTGTTLAKRICDVWMSTSFEGGRHARRVAKLGEIEEGHAPSSVPAS
ncbi:MAG: ribose 5-phosphate isomerase B [Planctomycetota bacterium]|nr:ribose 5-phosphate isomerase B [Planctomycetota bacterium]